MTQHIILSLAALFGLFQLARMTNNFAKVIVVILAFAISIVFISTTLTITIGYYLFGLMLLTSVFYVLIEKKGLAQRGLMLLITIPVFTSFISAIFHWPFSNEFSLMMLVPIFAYLILVTRKFSIKNEIGFLTVIVVQALFKFSDIVLIWIK